MIVRAKFQCEIPAPDLAPLLALRLQLGLVFWDGESLLSGAALVVTEKLILAQSLIERAWWRDREARDELELFEWVGSFLSYRVAGC